jgi:hypothetical protein
VHERPHVRKLVSKQELRQRFNEGKYWERVKSGELREIVRTDKPTKAAHQPSGSRSQIIAYFDGSRKVAIVHQYLRADGSIGGSGRPDPNEITEDDVIYYCDSKD